LLTTNNWSFNLQNKTEIREALIKKRKDILPAERTSAGLSAAALFQKSDLFQNNKNFACYFAMDSEFDCAPIIELILNADKKCYIPTLSIYHKQQLQFSLYQDNMPLQKNRFQIHEPMFAEKISIDRLDVVFFPTVGFDLQGHRLGMGGGYYDRTFESIDEKNKPFFLGLAYELQKIDALPKDTWDVCLDGVLTEEKIYSFKS
jgi:5-formyltetrahydrofolate cyclo-ligase